MGWLKRNNRDHKLPGNTHCSECDKVVNDKEMFKCDFCPKRFEPSCLPCRNRNMFPYPNVLNEQRKTARACLCCLYAASTASRDEPLANIHKYTELSPAQKLFAAPIAKEKGASQVGSHSNQTFSITFLKSSLHVI